MIDADFQGADIDLLLSSLCDSGLTEPQRELLNSLLRSDANLRRRYRLYMGVHVALDYAITASRTARAEATSAWRRPSETPDYGTIDCCELDLPSSRYRLRCLTTVVFVLFLFVAGFGGVAWWARRDSPVEVSRRAPAVARISGTAGARFGSDRTTARLKDPLRVGRYVLVEGIVQVTFARGAEIVITGPAEFVLEAEDRMCLKRGKLTARIAERARGFTVETPHATLVDLGTEFAADVDREGNGEVHVFRGEVIVQPRSQTDSRPVRLTDAQATRIDSASVTPAGIEVDSSRFLRQLDEPKTNYSQRIRDLEPNVYLRMEPTVDGHSLIDSAAVGRFVQVVVGPDSGTPWLPSYFGSALRLRGPSSGEYARIPAIEKQSGVTLSVVAWVFAESRPRWASIAKRWGDPGDRRFHFGLFGDDGDLEVHINQPNGEEVLVREGRPLSTRRWHHVAFVADGARLRLYRNGLEVASAAYDGLQPGMTEALGIGVKLDPTGVRPDQAEPGYWHGRLDEVSIFAHPLKPDQIHQLHQVAAVPEPNGAN